MWKSFSRKKWWWQKCWPDTIFPRRNVGFDGGISRPFELNRNRIQLCEGKTMAPDKRVRAVDDLSRLFVEWAMEGDAVGIAALDEPTAIMVRGPSGLNSPKSEVSSP